MENLINSYINFISNILGSTTEKHIIWVIGVSIIICIIRIIFDILRKLKINAQIDNLANNTIEMTPKEFMKMRNTSFGGKGRPSYALTRNFAGVYILYNETKDMYYVGQGKQVLNRVNNHFTGKGNGDVYADYKYGDIFSIKMIALENSGFKTLNELERHTIARYNAFSKGYNKTRGNRN